MNTGSLGRFSKGAINHTKHFTASVSGMVFAFGLTRLGAMRSTREVGTLAPQQRRALLGFGFFGSHFSKSSLPDLFSGFRCSNIAPTKPFMPVSKMFFWRQTFKVIGSVVRLVAIDVMNVFGWIEIVQPARSYYTMHQSSTTENQISLRVVDWSIWLELSENFSAARDGVNVVKESVNDSVYFYA